MQTDRSRHTPIRHVRVPDPLWDAAQAVAAERGDNLAEVVRAALRDYVDKWGDHR